MKLYSILNYKYLFDKDRLNNLQFVFIDYQHGVSIMPAIRAGFVSGGIDHGREAPSEHILVINQLDDELKILLSLKGLYVADIEYDHCTQWLQDNIRVEESYCSIDYR